MNKKCLATLILVSNLVFGSSELFSIKISEDDENMLKANPDNNFSYLAGDIKTILRRIIRDENVNIPEECKSFSALGKSESRLVKTELAVDSIERLLNVNSDKVSRDLDNLKHYGNLLKEGEFNISLDNDTVPTRGHHKKLKVYKKNIDFKKDVMIKGKVVAKSLSTDSMTLANQIITKLKVHGNSPNVEVEYGYFVAENVNDVVFAVPFKNIPAILMNTNEGDTTTVLSISNKGFSVSTPHVTSGHTYAWLAIGELV